LAPRSSPNADFFELPGVCVMVTEFALRLPRGTILETLQFDELASFELFPAELVTIRSAVAQRRREFSAGRYCARRALVGLGLANVEIPSGQDRAPVWPAGIVGSISHCDGYAMAAVAARSTLFALGIDCELRRRVSVELSPAIVRPDECDGSGLTADPAGEWRTILFSAKEAVFKAVYQVTQEIVGFDAVQLRFSASGACFRANVFDKDGANLKAQPEGVVSFDSHRVLTAAWIQAQDTAWPAPAL
jgi:4'-phosphopantetheinyl transferase EntD